MGDALLSLLARLHARGLHAAVLAALIVMPTVTTVGYLTRGADPDRAAQGGSALRPTLQDPAGSTER